MESWMIIAFVVLLFCFAFVLICFFLQHVYLVQREKYIIYGDFIQSLEKIIFQIMDTGKIDIFSLDKLMIGFSLKSSLLTTSKILEKLGDFQAFVESNYKKDINLIVNKIFDLVIFLRKDLGKVSYNINHDDFWQILLKQKNIKGTKKAQARKTQTRNRQIQLL